MRSRLFPTITSLLLRSAHTAAGAGPAGPKPARRTQLRLGSIAFLVGASAGGLYAFEEYRKRKVPAKAVLNTDDAGNYILKAAPPFQPSRSVTFPMDVTGLKLTLYQYQTCPFCCKVRAMLDYFGISYDIVEVNPVLRTQLKWSEKYRKVPILIVETREGEVLQLNDSSMIISALFSYLQNLSKPKSESDNMLKVVKCYPTVQFAGEDGKMTTEIMNKYFIMNDMEADSKEAKQAIIHERKWRKWADSVYVHTLSPNIYRTLPEAVDSFKNFDRVGEWEKNFASWERALVIYVGAVAMWVIGKRLQKRHHLKPDVRQSLYEESDFWLQSIRKNGKGDFMGGAKPNLSDLAVYGVLNSIEGCEAFEDLAKNSKIISQWYRKVQQHLKNAPNKVEIYV